ncbi:MAG TPA: hypothetical protein VF711_12870 [Acidimicrobiales bacterium]|jgi:hypothetical protein
MIWTTPSSSARVGGRKIEWCTRRWPICLRINLFTGDNLLLDEYFDPLQARFTADPLADPFEDWTLTMVLTRL